MTTFTTYNDGSTISDRSGRVAPGAPDVTVIHGEFDASQRNLAAGDVAEVLAIPAGTDVHFVYVEVLTTDDATHVFNVGDGADPDGYVAGAAADALATSKGAGAIAAAGSKFYAAADTIDIEAAVGDPLDTLKVRIIACVTMTG